MLRRGFFTSPAVKVMLFHASAENSEPTCTTARITSTFTSTMGPPMPTCTGCSELQPAFFQNSLQPAPKFAFQAVALRPTVKPSSTSAASDSALAEVKMFWISAPKLDAEDIHDGQQNDDDDAGEVGRVDADLHVAQHHGADRESAGTWAMCQSQCVVEMVGKEDAKELAKRHADGGDGSGLDDEKQRPAVKKSPQRPQRLAQVNVLAAGLGHHRGQFAVAERANHGQHGRDHPRAQEERRRVGAAGDVGIDKKDAGADHGAGHEGGGAEQAEGLHQFGRAGAAECRF